MKKIAFIGIMGCGKSSIAKDVSKDLNMKLISVDEIIEKEMNLSISDIFEKFGERYFRKAETEVLSKVVLNENCIIDCGGGVVLNSRNIDILKDNGYSVIFIDRNPEDILKDIDVKNRPLLKTDPSALYKIYNERIELYRKYADFIVENDTVYDDVVMSVKEFLK